MTWRSCTPLASGQPLDHWEFYMALAYFKLAIIAAGIQFRDRMGGDPARHGVRRQGRRGRRPLHRDGPDRSLLARSGPHWGLMGRKWGTTGPNPRPGARTPTNGKAVTMPSETLRGRDASDATDETTSSRPRLRRPHSSVTSASTSTSGSARRPLLSSRSRSHRNPAPQVTESLSFTLNGKEIEADGDSSVSTVTASTSSTRASGSL